MMNPVKVSKSLDGILEAIGELEPRFKNHDIFVGKKLEIREIRKKNRLIRDLKSEAIKEHHLKDILIILRLDKNVNDLTIGDFLKLDVLKHEKKINDILSHAQGELVLENMLAKI